MAMEEGLLPENLKFIVQLKLTRWTSDRAPLMRTCSHSSTYPDYSHILGSLRVTPVL